VPLYGDGLNVRDWLHVDDHCNGIALVLTGGRAGEVYNIGGGTELTNREMTEQLLAACGKDWSSVQPVQDRMVTTAGTASTSPRLPRSGLRAAGHFRAGSAGRRVCESSEGGLPGSPVVDPADPDNDREPQLFTGLPDLGGHAAQRLLLPQ
jgi:hypothetical protein